MAEEHVVPFQYEDEYEDEAEIETLENGDVLIGTPEEDLPDASLREFDDNLTSMLDESALVALGEQMVVNYDIDVEARKDWLDVYTKGLSSMKPEELDNTQNPSASHSRKMATVIHPLIAEAATQFQARAIGELFPPSGPVGSQIVGETTEALSEQARRVTTFMNYQMTEEMEEYFPDLDQMMFHLPLVGQAYKKSWFDVNLGRITSQFVQAEHFVKESGSTSLRSATRYSHDIFLSRHDFDQYVANDFYDDVDDNMLLSDDETSITQEIDGIEQSTEDEIDAPGDKLHFIETHGFLDLESEEGGLDRPYVITTHKDTRLVVSIRRNWDEDDDKFRKNVWFVEYKFLPGLGDYGFGLYHIIGGLGKAATGALRALLDSAAFSNMQGGFKLRGRVSGGEIEIAPGEFPDINAAVDDIRKAVMPLPFKEPSQTMMQLLQYIVEAGKSFANTVETNLSDANQNTPVGTTMALLEENSRVFSAVHKRLHNSQKQEFKLIAKLNGIYLPDRYPYRVGTDDVVFRADFDSRIDIIPVSDPATFSSTQRISQAQAMLQMSKEAPDIHNKFKAYRRMYDALRIPNYDEILIDPDSAVRQDAVAENVAIMKQRPIKVFEDQDHMAHITVLDNWFAQIPPDMQPLYQPLYASHRSEHMAYYYRAQVQAQLQAPLPPMMMDEEDQKDISALQDAQISQAAAQMTMQNPQQPIGPQPPKPNQELQGAAQDPMAAAQMLAQAEAMSIQAKTQADIQAKQQKAQSDLQVAQMKAQMDMEIKQQEAMLDMQIEQMKMQVQAKTEMMKAQMKGQADQSKVEADIQMMWAKAQAEMQLAAKKSNDTLNAKRMEFSHKMKMDESKHNHQGSMNEDNHQKQMMMDLIQGGNDNGAA